MVSVAAVAAVVNVQQWVRSNSRPESLRNTLELLVKGFCSMVHLIGVTQVTREGLEHGRDRKSFDE